MQKVIEIQTLSNKQYGFHITQTLKQKLNTYQI